MQWLERNLPNPNTGICLSSSKASSYGRPCVNSWCVDDQLQPSITVIITYRTTNDRDHLLVWIVGLVAHLARRDVVEALPSKRALARVGVGLGVVDPYTRYTGKPAIPTNQTNHAIDSY